MTTDERLGTFDSVLKGSPPGIRALAIALRKRILGLHPGAFETPRNGERCTTYGVGPRKKTQAYAHIMPLRDCVNLGLYHGAVLSDPKGLLSGTGKGSRHAKMRSLGDVSSPATAALIRAAIAGRRRSQGA
jgi:hypothetical protein